MNSKPKCTCGQCPVHDVKTYRCYRCGDLFNNKPRLMSHIRETHSPKKRALVCPFCNAHLPPAQWRGMRLHLELYHLGHTPDERYVAELVRDLKPYRQLYKCKSCTFTHPHQNAAHTCLVRCRKRPSAAQSSLMATASHDIDEIIREMGSLLESDNTP